MDETTAPSGPADARVVRVNLNGSEPVSLPAGVASRFIERVYSAHGKAAADAMHFALTGHADPNQRGAGS